MESIIISLKPKWWEKILSGEKTEEIRKTMPMRFSIDEDWKFTPALSVYVYLGSSEYSV